MRTLFVGDVHSCADELEALLDVVGPDRIVLVGDVFNKGPDPARTWDLVRSRRAEAVLGNHDDKVLRKGDPGLAPDDARRWLATLPLFLEGRGWLCVHAGVDPTRGPAATPRDRALNVRRWPDDDTANPFWWELYQGPPLVIYGHDAVRGLVDRRPHTLGLDTGCVYGGRLTGYLLEEDRLVSVPARRVYAARASGAGAG